MHRAAATPAVGLPGPAPTPAGPFRRPSLARGAPAHTSGLNWRGGNRARPTSASHSLVVVPREAGPPRRLQPLIGPRRTSDRLTGRRQLQRGGERRRCKPFFLQPKLSLVIRHAQLRGALCLLLRCGERRGREKHPFSRGAWVQGSRGDGDEE